jgi:hypothetical protein
LENPRLVAEAGVDGADREARTARDLRHRHVGEALLGHELFRAVHQPLAGLDAAHLLRRADPSELAYGIQPIDFHE